MHPIIRVQAADERINGRMVLTELPSLGELVDVRAADSTVFILEVKDHVYDIETIECRSGAKKHKAAITLVCNIWKILPPDN